GAVGLSAGPTFADEQQVQDLAVEADLAEATVVVPKRPVDSQHIRKRRAKHVQAKRQRLQWWANARQVLFSGIDLSQEQSKQVSAIIQQQMDNRTAFTKLDVQLAVAMQKHDRTGVKKLREETVAARRKLKSAHELFDEMRATLNEDQQQRFDLNRAKLVSEGQRIREENRKRRQARKDQAKPDADGGTGGQAADTGPVGVDGVSDSEPRVLDSSDATPTPDGR
ncbi:MAG: hypothetical protein VX252_14240, partial [Myxococcota bacterium]|nr:hypothetical protein [Myxococcota bacterium]